MTLKKGLFDANPDASYWKIELQADLNSTLTGSSSILFKLNSLPYGGACFSDAYNGTALETYFLIQCNDWTDSDGHINRYEFYGSLKPIFLNSILGLIFYFLVDYTNLPNPIAINYNPNGILRVQLPVGPDYDSYKLKISIKIIDDLNGVTQTELPHHIRVYPNPSLTKTYLSQLNNDESKEFFVKQLQTGNLQTCSFNLISLSSCLNSNSSELDYQV